jgi:hypothetical protein
MTDRDATGAEPAPEPEESWLIAPPPPPPPVGSAVPSAGAAPEPASPPVRLPAASTPAVNAPQPQAAPPVAPVAPVAPGAVPMSAAPTDILAPPPGAAVAAVGGSPDVETAPLLDPIPGPAGVAGDPLAGGPAGASGGHSRHTGSHRFPLAGGSTAAKSALREVRAISPWMLASATILLAFAVAWLAGIFLSFRHLPGFTGRDRVLQFFEPGSFEWALAVLLALALLEVGRRFDPAPGRDTTDLPAAAHVRKTHLTRWLPVGLFLAGAAVCVSSAVGVLVELTAFGNGIDAAFSNLINYLGILAVAAAATWWAFRDTSRAPS